MSALPIIVKQNSPNPLSSQQFDSVREEQSIQIIASDEKLPSAGLWLNASKPESLLARMTYTLSVFRRSNDRVVPSGTVRVPYNSIGLRSSARRLALADPSTRIVISNIGKD
ncbi:hypothetical protein QOT17_018826 [Balamuthia mandrillaris]